MSSLSRRTVLALTAGLAMGCRPKRRRKLTSLGRVGVLGLAADETAVYWTTGPSNGALFRVSPAGKTERMLASGLHHAEHLVAHGDWLYLALHDRVARILRTGGPLTTLAPASHPFRLAIEGDEVRFVERGTGRLARVPVTGGAVETLASGLATPVSLAVSGPTTYVASDRDGTIVACGKAGESPKTVAAKQLAIRDLCVVDGALVWTAHKGVMVAREEGAAPQALVKTARRPACLVQRDRRLAWATSEKAGDRLWSLDWPQTAPRPEGAPGPRVQHLALAGDRIVVCDLRAREIASLDLASPT